jgi:hypothetical protein
MRRRFQFGIIHLMGVVALAAFLVRFPNEIGFIAGIFLGLLACYFALVAAGMPLVIAFECVYRRWLWRHLPLNHQPIRSPVRAVALSVCRNILLVLCGCAIMLLPQMAIGFFGVVLSVATVCFVRMLRGREPFEL